MKKEELNMTFLVASIRSAAHELQTVRKDMSKKEIEKIIKVAENYISDAKEYLKKGV